MNMVSPNVCSLRGPRHARSGFTLIEVMITVVIISIITAVAYPSYITYVKKASRQAAQTQLLQMAALQEKIYLNSNAYTGNVTANYDGTSAGGLGNTAATTTDGKYTISVSPLTASQAFTLTATPVATGAQAGDGNLSISSSGVRVWGATTW